MQNSTEEKQEIQSDHIEKLLDAANSASQTIAALHIAFLAFVAYVGVIVWGTTHEDLLRISPVKLPILDVELPLTAFYNFVPWMVVLLHFNLLMQLELLSCKLWNLDRDLPANEAGQQVRDRLFIFPLTHLIAGRSSVFLIRWLLSLVVGITLIALPLFVLLAAQIRFLPFHDEAITWSQRIAVWVDAILLLTLWPLIASPQDRALEWWRNAGFQLSSWLLWLKYAAVQMGHRIINIIRPAYKTTARQTGVNKPVMHSEVIPKGMIVLLISVPLVVFLSLLAVIPGNTTLQNYYNPEEDSAERQDHEETPRYFEDWLIRKVPAAWLSVAAYQYNTVACTSLPQAEKSEATILKVVLGTCGWFNLNLFPRNLDLKEAKLVPKEVSMALLTRATDPDKPVRDSAFKEFEGLNLQNRDLRFANFYGAVLPKADLRHVQLQGAVLLNAKLQGVIGWDKTQLQGAVLGGTQLQGAGLIEADLRGADLRGANLQGADLGWANLQSADLRGAVLQGVNLRKAQMQAADLRGANLQGANLQEANLAAGSLDYANLQGADLSKTKLRGTVFRKTQLQGAVWPEADLTAGYLSGSAYADWSQQQHQLRATLKALFDAEKFNAFEERIDTLKPANPFDKLTNLTGCYSDNPAVLPCVYRQPEQMNAYRAALFPELIALACSDVTIAAGICRRAFEKSGAGDPDYDLASALSKTSTQLKTCEGLSDLPEQIKLKLMTQANSQDTQSAPPTAR